MLFNSLQYLIFLPVTVLLYFSIPPRYRWILLLAASYYFYMCWKVGYVVLIAATTLVAYGAALRMAQLPDRRRRRPWFILSLVANLGVLFVFKYFNFFCDTLEVMFHRLKWTVDLPVFRLLLPVGISFYTFQLVAYTIEVYRGEQKVERHLGYFALFVSFFPQLVAGPIERSSRLLPQLRLTFRFDYDRVVSGLRLILWGMFKKVCIADLLALFVNEIYRAPAEHTTAQHIVATYFFAFQVYCDFSGYSDIAIGSARIFGIDLMENFRQPLLARSIREFWARWHISLTTWFRDYVYIPLGGNRGSIARTMINLVLVFGLSGLWHGANYTFILFGLLHGLFMVAGQTSRNRRTRLLTQLGWNRIPLLPTWVQVAIVFHLFVFSLIIFRALSLGDAWYIISHLGSGFSGDLEIAAFQGREFQHAWTLIGILMLVQIIQERLNHREFSALVGAWPVAVRWLVYYFLLFACLYYGQFSGTQFIYFQF